MWLVYSLIQSYRNLEKELKEIRAKCIGVNAMTPKKSVSKPDSVSKPVPVTTPVPVTSPDSESTTEKSPAPKSKTTQGSGSGYYSSTQTGAYTSTGDEIYTNTNKNDDKNNTKYDNDPISSMKNTLVGGLNALKMYASI